MAQEYQLKNYMEEVVEMIFKEVSADLDVCTCEQCKMDILALALNNLPAKYFVTQKGQAFSRVNMLRQQFEIDAVTAVTSAAKVISRKPRHK